MTESVKIELLDHGFIRLRQSMGGDLQIVQNARQSYDQDDIAGIDEMKDAKLIRYLLMNGHTTPFEVVTATFEVKAPIFVFRQWHRHRTQSYNEVSARYVELPEEVYIPTIEVIGKQHSSNKQMRVIIDDMTDEETRRREEEIFWVQEHAHASFCLYHKLIERGWPRELARGVLPFFTYSRMSTTANLLNFMKFMELRLHEHAQYEIRVYAEVMRDIFRVVAPVAMAVFDEKLDAESK